MTPAQITALRDYLKTDPTLVTLANSGLDQSAADVINARTATVIEKPKMIGERGIMSALGITAGPVFMSALDDFAAATLAADHPLLAYQPGIKRAVKWLYGEGLDVGDPLTRSMLDALAAASVIALASATAVKAVAEKTVSYPVSLGWGTVTENDIAWAARDAVGNSLLGA